MADGTTYRPTTTLVVSYDASVQSSAIPANYFKARLQSTSNCYVKIGTDPTATTNEMPLTAGVPEYFTVAPTDKIAAIKLADAGVLSITLMT